jgi:hypothetical protein
MRKRGALGYGTEIAAKEHKDRKKELDKDPLKLRKLECEP